MHALLIVVSWLFVFTPVFAQPPSSGLVVSLTADRDTAYVNEQILLTLEVQLPAVAFSLTGTEPAVEGAEVISVNKQTSTRVVNDVPIKTVRTVYALFASAEATLTVSAQRFQAVLPISATNSISGSSNRNPKISAQSDPLTLQIAAAPVAASGFWFAAQDVKITSEWSASSRDVRAGEPVNRHISVQVKGQRVKAIPALDMRAPDGLRLYPDLPEPENTLSSSGINSARVQSTAVIAPVAGSYSMPEMSLEWWDINRREWRVATLAEEEFVFSASEWTQATSEQHNWKRERVYYMTALALITGVALAGVAASALLWARVRRLTGKRASAAVTERRAWALLIGEIRRGDAVSIRQALLQWARQRWPAEQLHRLDQVARKYPDDPQLILALDAEIYGSAQQADRSALKAVLKSIRRAGKPSADRLARLYPV